MTVKQLIVKLLEDSDLDSQIYITKSWNDICQDFTIENDVCLDEGGLILAGKYNNEECVVLKGL